MEVEGEGSLAGGEKREKKIRQEENQSVKEWKGIKRKGEKVREKTNKGCLKRI